MTFSNKLDNCDTLLFDSIPLREIVFFFIFSLSLRKFVTFRDPLIVYFLFLVVLNIILNIFEKGLNREFLFRSTSANHQTTGTQIYRVRSQTEGDEGKNRRVDTFFVVG